MFTSPHKLFNALYTGKKDGIIKTDHIYPN
jgi:hypothetical protein